MPFVSYARVMREGRFLYAVDPSRLNTYFSLPAATVSLEELHAFLEHLGYVYERPGTDDDKLIGYEAATVLEMWAKQKSPAEREVAS
jgi:hypothetical protein